MAFLNSPMAEVWKVTKRTFSELVDVDRAVSSESQTSANVRPTSRYDEPILNPIRNANSMQTDNTRPEDVGSTFLRQNEGPDLQPYSRGTQTNVGQTNTSKSRLAKSGLTTPHDSRSRIEDAPSRTKVQASITSPTNPSRSFEQFQGSQNVHTSKVKPNKFNVGLGSLGLRSHGHGLSQPKSSKPSHASTNTKTVSLSQSRPTEEHNDYFRQSPTLHELTYGLYPQYAAFQPRDPTIMNDQPLSLPELELSEIQGSTGSGESSKTRTRNRNEELNSRNSRTPERKSSSKYRSNSSDRAKEMKIIQRSPSYSKSRMVDVNKMSDEDDDEDWLEQAEKVKLKVMSMWNNVKYGWTVKTKTPFNIHKAIWLLGKCYHHRPEDPELGRIPPGMNTTRSPAMELFKQDFVSRIWLTYRREFPQLSGSSLTTDCGWGCMLRSGQMLLAQALILHFLGRDWNLYKGQTVESDKLHRQIIHWFGDQPSDMSPFSVHQMVDIGKRCGKRAGDWFGPSSVAHIIKEAVERAPELNPMLDNICIYVSQDCTVYKQDVIDLCTKRRKLSLKPVLFDVEARTPEDISPHGETLRSPEPQSVKDNSRVQHQGHHKVTVHAERKSSDVDTAPGTNNNIESNSRSKTSRVGSDSERRNSYEGMCNDESTENNQTEPTGESMKDWSVLDDSSFERILKRFDSEFERRSSHRQNDTVDGGESRVDRTQAESEDETLGSDWEQVSQQGTPPVNHPKTTPGTMQDTKVDKVSQQGTPPVVGNHPKASRGSISVDKENEENKDPMSNRKNGADGQRQEEPRGSSNCEDENGTVHSNNSHSPTEEYTSDWCAVIILVPVRLGGEEVNGIYIRPLQSLFSMTNCIGIIGGKPKHSLYFVGFQDEKLIHLDPHYCQQVVDMGEKNFPIWSFHCMSPRKMAMTKMDPSCTIGFYLRTREDFDKFCIEIQQVINPPGNTKDYPMFIIREGRCKDWNAQNESSARNERYLRVRHVNQDGQLISPVTAAEDFVLLD